VTRIYGAEPCVPLHNDLLASARKHGLGDIYEIIPCSGDKDSLIPGLAKAGLLDSREEGEDGAFDTIVCVRVLCSVTNLKDTCEALYRLLKKGGRLLVTEHEVNPIFSPSTYPSAKCGKGSGTKGSLVARIVQVLYTMMGWSFFVGNCHLQRDIEGAILEAGRRADEQGKGWAEVHVKKDFGWAVLPYVSGVFTKSR
jgi:SAM-dependent methyltransferase